jgi:gluconolactonase
VFISSYSSSAALAAPFHIYHENFLSILGKSPKLSVFAEDKEKFFAHESGIWIPATNEIFFTSNQIRSYDGTKSISLYKFNTSSPGTVECLDSTEGGQSTIMLNGGTNHPDGGLIFCQQGNLKIPSAVVYMSSTLPYKTYTIINNFNGRPFNSVNDVVVHPDDGSIWFTDPAYGHAGGWRPEPSLPPLVYVFQPKTGEIRVVADGFFRPNGITFSPDCKKCYITDTGAGHGDGHTFEWGTKPATMFNLSHFWLTIDMCLILAPLVKKVRGPWRIEGFLHTAIKAFQMALNAILWGMFTQVAAMECMYSPR